MSGKHRRFSRATKWIEGLSATAAIITALASAWTLWINIVERREVDDLHTQAVRQEEVLSNALTRVTIYGDLLAAEGGDRFAFEHVQHLLWDNADKKSLKNDPLSDRLDFSIRRFTGDIKDNPILAAVLETPFFESMDVPAMLGKDMFIQRLYALKHIREFRLNKYLPDIVELLKKEPNLNVVQFAIALINETFEDNMIFNAGPRYHFTVDECVLRPELFDKAFEETWEFHKQKILSRKPKEARQGRDKNPPHFNLMYIYDPEKPLEVPVMGD